MNESTARNIRVQDRYDELMRIGRHGHYETMFQVVREEIESLRQQLASCDAEIERLKTVPMRYRRMAFNAQLQKENDQLRQQLAASAADAKRYQWLVYNSFDIEEVTQLHVWIHTWEPHSLTGEPTEWKARVIGPAIDRVIDEVIAATAPKEE